MAVEPRRACGYRKVGGLYLVSGQLAEPCHRLPFPLTVCPCCGSGFKPARGWTWLNPVPLFGPGACIPAFETSHCDRCVVCQPSKWPRPVDKAMDARYGPGRPPAAPRAGLLWVGGQFYPTPAAFEREAEQLGVSRRIPHLPHDFQLGTTWVLLAHRRAIPPTEDTIALLAPEPAGFAENTPGIFHLFRPTAVEKLVKESDLTPEAMRDALKRGITLVPVPDDDRDHQGSLYDDDSNGDAGQGELGTDPEPPEREGPPYTDAVDDEDGLSELERDTREPPDPAWESERRLRDMEGHGDYDGPRSWP